MAAEMQPAERDPAKDAENEEKYQEALAAEREAHAKKEAAHDASWTKRVLTAGTGRAANKGDVASLHLVGRLSSSTGTVFEDSRARGLPLLVILGRGVLVPGLDRAVLAMTEGEKASITVNPDGGYGAAGNIEFPRVPGSATLVYEAELVKLEAEDELWDLDFETKMQKAAARRERGNALFRGGFFKEADDEYEQGMRYLFFMPHPTEEQAARIKEDVATMNLNLTAAKLRCGHENAAISCAQKVLDTHPEHPKALYRIGQAYTQLGKYERAKDFLQRAEKASGQDAGTVAAVRKELKRLQDRKDRHDRQRKRAYAKMVSGKDDDDRSVLRRFRRSPVAIVSLVSFLVAVGASVVAGMWSFTSGAQAHSSDS